MMSAPQKPKPKPVNDKLVDAQQLFGPGKQLSKELPEFTTQDLSDMGVSFVETDTTRLLKVPFAAQKQLVEALKKWGFGAGHALDLMLRKILKAYGFTGRVQTRAEDEDGSFDWVAFESKNEDAEAQPVTSAPSRGGDEKLFLEEMRDYFANSALPVFLTHEMERDASSIDAQLVAKSSFKVADAMLVARKVGQ
jgi:hypothetical protein